MINRKEITDVAKRMLRRHRGLEDPQIIHPQRDWLIGVSVSLLLLAVIIWWCVSSYIKHSQTNIESATETASTETVYREGQVKSALEFFDAKRKRYDELMSDKITQSREIVTPPVVEETLAEPNVVDEVKPTPETVVEEVSPEVVEEEVVPTLSE